MDNDSSRRPDDSARAGTRSTREDPDPGTGEGPLKGPHERDESTGAMEPGTDRASGRRAYEDLAAGRVDTDLRGSAREIIERAQQERAEAGDRPARGQAPSGARPVTHPVKE